MATLEGSLEDPADREILYTDVLYEADATSVLGLRECISVAGCIDTDFQSIPYDTCQTIGEMVRCAVCANGARHYTGFIVRSGAGEVGLGAIECGEAHLFDEGGWQEMFNQTALTQQAALYEYRWRPAKAVGERIYEALQPWAELVHPVDNQQNEFADVIEELLGKLHTELREGTLSVHKEVMQRRRDADGSEREYPQYEPVVFLRTRAV